MTGQRGLIVKIKGSHCIVVTADGIYKEIPLPTTPVRVGSEIYFNERTWRHLIRPVALAASIIVLLFSLALLRSVVTPQPAAFVSLDINPSIELAVNQNLQVIATESYNPDGAKLLENVRLKGINLNQAVRTLVNEATRKHYLSPDREGMIVATIAQSLAEKIINNEALNNELAGATKINNVKARILVYEVDETLRQSAREQGLTAGKYLVFRQAQAAGIKVRAGDIKTKSIRSFIEAYKINLLPNNKIIVLKKLKNLPGETIELDNLLQNQKYLPNNEKVRNTNGREMTEVIEKPTDVQNQPIFPNSNNNGHPGAQSGNPKTKGNNSQKGQQKNQNPTPAKDRELNLPRQKKQVNDKKTDLQPVENTKTNRAQDSSPGGTPGSETSGNAVTPPADHGNTGSDSPGPANGSGKSGTGSSSGSSGSGPLGSGGSGSSGGSGGSGGRTR